MWRGTPAFTFRLKESVQADLPATAVPVDGAQKQRVLEATASLPGSGATFGVETSPLVEVTLAGAA